MAVNATQFRTILGSCRSNVALVIGNGINRHGSGGAQNGWDTMVIKLAKKYLGETQLTDVPNGISLTELYDLIQISDRDKNVSKLSLHSEFCEPMCQWKISSTPQSNCFLGKAQ